MVRPTTPQTACDVCREQGAAHVWRLLDAHESLWQSTRGYGDAARKRTESSGEMPPAAGPEISSGISRITGSNGRVPMKKFVAAALAAGIGMALSATGASAQATLAQVKQRGILNCGSNTASPPLACRMRVELEGARRRSLPRHLGDDLQHPTKVFIPLSGQGPLHGAPVGEVHARPQLDLDDDARRLARPALHRREST